MVFGACYNYARMKQPPFFASIKSQHVSREAARRAVMAKSTEALSKSKRAIFALHRDDKNVADQLFLEANKLFTEAESIFKKFPSLRDEGSYRAALEEYAEALLYAMYVDHKPLGKIHARAMEPSIYLGGLSDTTGEIVRYAMRQVTQGNLKEAARARETVEMVIEFMLDLDLTGYLRTKFDQAKKNLRQLEEMMYELSLRK